VTTRSRRWTRWRRRGSAVAVGLIIDLSGATERHDLVTIGSLFGVEVPEAGSFIEAFEEQERGRRAQGGVVYTQDADFDEIPGVRVVRV